MATTTEARSRGCSSRRGRLRGIVLIVLVLPVLVIFALSAQRARASVVEDGDTCALFEQDHAAWTSFLGRYVRDGRVDYAGIKREGEGDLADYLTSLQSVCHGHYGQWSRHEKLAFWINAYNAYTIRLILDHYPIDSIRSIGFLPGSAFRRSFITVPAADMGTLSLDDIENEILRAEFREPRIHFAIVCASKACPALRSEAYRAVDLDRQLDSAATDFVNDHAKNHFDPVSRTLSLSSIFKWFRDDFEAASKTLPAFVARYVDGATATAIRAGDVRVVFLNYDWSLNGR